MAVKGVNHECRKYLSSQSVPPPRSLRRPVCKVTYRDMIRTSPSRVEQQGLSQVARPIFFGGNAHCSIPHEFHQRLVSQDTEGCLTVPCSDQLWALLSEACGYDSGCFTWRGPARFDECRGRLQNGERHDPMPEDPRHARSYAAEFS